MAQKYLENVEFADWLENKLPDTANVVHFTWPIRNFFNRVIENQVLVSPKVSRTVENDFSWQVVIKAVDKDVKIVSVAVRIMQCKRYPLNVKINFIFESDQLRRKKRQDTGYTITGTFTKDFDEVGIANLQNPSYYQSPIGMDFWLHCTIEPEIYNYVSCPAPLFNNEPTQTTETISPLIGDLTYMWTRKEYKDLTLIVGNNQIFVNKAILASRSAVLDGRISAARHTNEPVKICDVDHETMLDVLQYIYTERVENLSKRVVKILMASERLAIKGLTSICEQELIRQLTVVNASKMLELGVFYQLTDLKHRTIELIARNPHIMRTDEFRNLQKLDKYIMKDFVVYADLLVEHAM